MAKDIEFALAILKSDYKKRRDNLFNEYRALTPNRLGDYLSELEEINAAVIKIEIAFKE